MEVWAFARNADNEHISAMKVDFLSCISLGLGTSFGNFLLGAMGVDDIMITGRRISWIRWQVRGLMFKKA